ncbi:hypothetical protein H5410_005960 [Solanum commersonii]|uniref:Uncharacterized protein n=1 Tax=Solanum commersonii TaxID=4109 RepID=A0A9J6A7V1_SOLCO|nr:hypothetical protein H5410_005960 [Solanum commersonii]
MTNLTTRGDIYVYHRVRDVKIDFETKGFSLSKIKTEYVECKFNDVLHEIGMKVRLDTQNIPMRARFKYFGSTIQKSGDFDDDITRCIGVAWMKWKLASGVYHKTSKVSSIEWWLDQLCFMGLSVGQSRNSRIPCLEDACCRDEDVKVDIREAILRWFGHIYEEEIDRCTYEKVQVTEDMILDMRVWRTCIRVEGW